MAKTQALTAFEAAEEPAPREKVAAPLARTAALAAFEAAEAPSRSTLQAVGAGAWSGLGWVGWGLDIPRRGIAYAGYRVGGLGHDESIAASRTGQELVKMLSPEFAREHPQAAWGLGLGQEILADPINLLLMGGLTTTGLAAKKAGQLGPTWARQAQAGRRAFLQLRVPTFKPGWSWSLSEGLRRVQLIKSPRGVEQLARLGNVLARPFSALRAVSPNPLVRHLFKHVNPHLDVNTQMLRMRDIAEAFEETIPKHMVRDVRLAAEHIGKTGDLHARLLEPFDRKTLEIAATWKGYYDTAKDIAQRATGREQIVGGGLRRLADETRHMESKTITQMAIKVNKHVKGLSKKQKSIVGDYLSTQAKASGAQEQAARLMGEAWDLELAGKLSGETKGRITEQLRVANQTARRFEREAIEQEARLEWLWRSPGPSLEALKTKYHAARAKRVVIEAAMENLPNDIARSMTPDGIQRVVSRQGKGAGVGKFSFTDDFLGHQERRWGERFDAATMQPLEAYEQARRVVKREAGLLEVDEWFKNPMRGSAQAQYAAMPDGIIERVTNFITRKTPKPLIEKMYKLDLTSPIDQMIKRTMNALNTRSMLQDVLGNPELFTRTLGAGQDTWVPLRKLSTAMQKKFGQGFIHPDLFRAIRRTTTNVRFPDSMYKMVKGIDKFTQTFKKMVTGWWPAYNWRNHVTDTILSSSIGVNPTAAWRDGAKAVWPRWLGTHGVDTVIDCGRQYGKMAPDDVQRMARALGVTFGEVTEAGVTGYAKQFEDVRRIGALVDRVRHGFTWQQAALEVKSVLFDYKQLAPIERELLKRVIPFYSWFRNNVRLQAQWAFHTPALTQAQLRIGRPRAEELPYVPTWVKGRTYLSMSPDHQTGEERILLGLDLPVEDIAELLDFNGGFRPWMKRIAFRANPLLKLGLGAVSGYDLDRATLLDRPASAPYLRLVHQEDTVHWNFLKRVAGARAQKTHEGKTYYTVQPYWDFVLRNSMFSRYWNSLVKRPAQAMEQVSRGKITTGQAAGEYLGGFLTGYRIQRYDKEEQRRRNRQREAQKALESLARVGDVRFFKVAYRPKGSQAPEKLVKDLADARAGR